MIHPPAFTTPSASHALRLLQRVQHGVSPVELVYTAHERWPLRPGQTIHDHFALNISVLDSSFNPPTLAHLALANSLPSASPPFPSAESYDARVLLLSVRNADKIMRLGDATFTQRLEMMRLLSHDIRCMETADSGSVSSQMSGNVAIAIINEPIFARKSALLLRFLRTRLATLFETNNPPDVFVRRGGLGVSCLAPLPKLTFLIGFDTLVRLFSHKYYSSAHDMVRMLGTFLSPDQEDCRLVCASRRSGSSDGTLQGTRATTFDMAREFITSGRIAFIDIGDEEQTYSSSEVRSKVLAGDTTWKKLVTDAVAQFIVKQGVYLSRGEN